MLQQANDFRDETQALHSLLLPLAASDYEQPTLFKEWDCNDILRHLHFWNQAADLSLCDETAFGALLQKVFVAVTAGDLRQFENDYLDGLAGPELLADWQTFAVAMSARFAAADPKARVKWAGPDMSVRSSITARLMETWAHAQAAYDALGAQRQDDDRIRNIAILGVNTFGWTFQNRKLPVPELLPYVRLTAPSGATWEWNEVQHEERIEGSATAFCQTVTQTRNVADTDLKVSGEVAQTWMRFAQCFAGPPHDPPAPGTRFRQQNVGNRSV